MSLFTTGIYGKVGSSGATSASAFDEGILVSHTKSSKGVVPKVKTVALAKDLDSNEGKPKRQRMTWAKFESM